MSEMNLQEKSNLELCARAFAAFQAGDAETLVKCFAPDAYYGFAPFGKFTGDYRGVQAIMGFFGEIAQATQGTFRVNPLAMSAAGDRVFVLYEARGQRDGKTLHSQEVGVFTLAGGVVTQGRVFAGDYPASAAFWS